jgi:CheY-like chemotaxis protein
MQKILAVMSDLFFSAKIMDEAKKLGMKATFVKDSAVALEQLQSNPAIAILDLNCASASPLDVIAAARQAGIPTVGFLSHVQTDLRQKALDAGCDTVVARSVFAQNLPAILGNAGQGRALQKPFTG